MSTDRRAAYRELVLRLDPAAPPKRAIEQRLYIEPANSINLQLATRLELDPTSSHMLVGGIGSGKTTQLLKVQERLAATEDVRAFYVDVLKRQNLEHLNKPGVLLALAGIELVEVFRTAAPEESNSNEIQAALHSIEQLAKGRQLDRLDLHLAEQDAGYAEEYVWHGGIIVPPADIDNLTNLAGNIAAVCSTLPWRPVMLFDGLDRLGDIANFIMLVAHDLQLLKGAGVGVVVVAPQHARTWKQGEAGNFFDELHLHGAAALSDNDGIEFLQLVLQARAAESGLLPNSVCTELASWSGGLIRDLLAMARAAAEEAYRLGTDAVAIEHVRTAVDRFGRNLLIGIDQAANSRLGELTRSRKPTRTSPFLTFSVATEVDITLLLRRLIIEVATTPVQYIFHPTIEPLLSGLRRSG